MLSQLEAAEVTKTVADVNAVQGEEEVKGRDKALHT
jgi:hypothetical protein